MPKQKKTGKQDITKVDSFYSDISKPDTLHAMILRSPSTGTVAHLHVNDLPEGYFFFSAKDIDGQNFITTNGIDAPIFAEKEIAYAGEPLGLVVGENLETVKTLLSQIEIQFEENDSLIALANVSSDFTADATDSPENTKIEAGNSEEIAKISKEMNILPENSSENQNEIIKNSSDENVLQPDKKIILASRQLKIYRQIPDADSQKQEKTDAAPEEETLTEISESCSIKLFAPNWLETDGAFCEWKNKNIIIYARTSCPEKLRDDIAKILAAPDTEDSTKITVKITKDHPQNTGGLWRTTVFCAMAALAATKTEKNIMLALDRVEQTKFMPHYPDIATNIKATVDASGKITSIKIDAQVDCGTSNPYAQDIVDRLAISATSIYRFESAEINITAVSSEKTPTSMPRQMIDTPIFLGLENLMNKIAFDKNLLPTEVRQMHIKETEFPLSLKEEKIQKLFDQLAVTSDLYRKYTSFASSGKNRVSSNEIKNDIFDVIPLRGIGFACAYSGSDFLGDMAAYENCNITINVDKITELNEAGDEIEAESVTLQGFPHLPEIKQQWISRLEKELRIPRDRIRFEKTDEAESMCVMATTFDKCLETAKKARIKGSSFENYPVVFEERFSEQTDDLGEIWNEKEFSGKPFNSATIGGAVVELFIDKYTDEIIIKEIHVAIDCGKIISKNVAERTVRLAIQQELSVMVENENTKCRQISITLIESDDTPADLGDIVHNMLPAAFCASLSQALGARISSLPFSFERFAQLEQNKINEPTEKEADTI